MRPRLGLAFVIILSIFFTGCFNHQPQGKKITVWHWLNDREQIFDELAHRYKEISGVQVEFKLIPSPDIYAQKVTAAARSNNLPDIYGILGQKNNFASFIKGGHVADITPEMQKDNNAWRNNFYQQNINIVSFEKNNTYGVPEGIYAVPIDTAVLRFVYNKKLFRKAGLDPEIPPKTIDEMIECAKKIEISESKNYGFVCGWGEPWLIYAIAVKWAINIMGKDKFYMTLEGKVPYTDKDWIKVFSLFTKLREAAIFAPNIATMVNKEAEDIFSQDKAAFAFDGSWSVNIYQSISNNLDYGFFDLLPYTETNTSITWGGTGSFFVINQRSPLKQESIDFMRWLTQQEQQLYMAQTTNNIPAIKIDTVLLPEKLAALTTNLEQLTHPNIWPVNEEPRTIEVINKDLQQLIMGLKDPQTVAKEIEDTKKRFKK